MFRLMVKSGNIRLDTGFPAVSAGNAVRRDAMYCRYTINSAIINT